MLSLLLLQFIHCTLLISLFLVNFHVCHSLLYFHSIFCILKICRNFLVLWFVMSDEGLELNEHVGEGECFGSSIVNDKRLVTLEATAVH